MATVHVAKKSPFGQPFSTVFFCDPRCHMEDTGVSGMQFLVPSIATSGQRLVASRAANILLVSPFP